MCGIAGILRVHPPGVVPPPPERAIPESWLDTLDDAVRHRGPDGQGRFRDRATSAQGSTLDVAFVHRRLSILDHPGGAQPMLLGTPGVPPTARVFHGRPGDQVAYRPAAARLAIVFNGCVYNHRNLRRALQADGARFATDHSDTEAILHAHAQWGEVAPTRLEGMFAHATWDADGTSLLLARDIAGEKPLYFSRPRADLFAFASTAAALVQLHRVLERDEDGIVPIRPDPAGVLAWLRFGASSLPLLAPIAELPPRSLARVTADASGSISLIARPYEALPERQAEGTLDLDALERTLEDAVRARLEADVPIGCFLSGGVDSSLVAAYARREIDRLTTFTIRMPDPRYDESRFAERVAKSLGTDHHTLACDARPADQLPGLITQLGLPFGDSSLLPTHWVSKAAGAHARVALSGDGGDELFGGYERYAVHRLLASPLRLVLRLLPRAIDRGADPKSRRSKLARLAAAARQGYQDLLAVFPRDELRALVPPTPGESTPLISDPLRHDFEEYLPSDLLRKSDTASMAVPLEVRAPLLARPVVHLGLSTPFGVLMPAGERKGLLRALARRLLPREVVDRPKMGFAIPIGEWFRDDFGQLRSLLVDTLRVPDPFPIDLVGVEIDRRRVATLLDEHLNHRRDHSQRLYLLLVLALWCRWRGDSA